MNIAVIESGMIFGFYRENDFFWIEKSEAITKINKKAKAGEGVKISEFLLLKRDGNAQKIALVEAKTNPPPIDDENPRLKDFIEDVKMKFTNSLALFMAIYLGRHNNLELSDNFKKLQLSEANFLLILVIKNCKKEQSGKLQEKLQKALKPILRIWNVSNTSPVIVINEDKAKHLGLVYRPQSMIS